MEPIVLVGGPSDGAEHTIGSARLRDVCPQFKVLLPVPFSLGGRGGEEPIRRPVVEHYELLRDVCGMPSRDDMGRLRFQWRGEW